MNLFYKLKNFHINNFLYILGASPHHILPTLTKFYIKNIIILIKNFKLI